MSQDEYLSDENVTEFAKTREKVEAATADRHEAVCAGEAIDVLLPYAKVYLGLYLDVDNRNPPEKRVQLLAPPSLAPCIYEGLHAVLVHGGLPEPAVIAGQMARGKRLAVGFIALAAAHRLVEIDGIDTLLALPDERLAALLCFHHANKSALPAPWIEHLLTARHDIAAGVYQVLWTTLARHGLRFMPGLPHVLDTPALHPILASTIVPLLEEWHDCADKELRRLLGFALRLADHEALLALSVRALADESALPIRKRVYWMATAFLLSPDTWALPLTDYCHGQRQKVLPLLDFCVDMLTDCAATRLQADATRLAALVRIIAPVFPRVQALDGQLDDISRKVLWLFDRLAACRGADAEQAVRRLLKVRVMKIYADVLKDILAQMQA